MAGKLLPVLFVTVAAAPVTLERRAQAAPELDWTFRGFAVSDLRYVAEQPVQPFYGPGFSYNENRLSLRLQGDAGEHVALVGHLELVYLSFSNVSDVGDITTWRFREPLGFESDAAYVDLRALAGGWLDVRVGRQIVTWGAADQFNPTDNLNAKDFHDPLTFGESLGNEMVLARVAPPPLLEHDVSLTAVFVPYFRPARLPAPALAALSDPSFAPEALALPAGMTFGRDMDIRTEQEPASADGLDDAQWAVRLGGRLLDTDVSVSYYDGRDDLPLSLPARADVTVVPDLSSPWLVRPVTADLTLAYPRVRVAGADFSTQLPFLWDAGLWAEAGVFFPERIPFEVSAELEGGGAIDAGSMLPEIEPASDGRSFLKYTVGTDYTFTRWLYANAQFVHGFVDEFGAGALNDYAVIGADTKHFGERLLLRAFVAYCVQDQSLIGYPQVTWSPLTATAFDMGALVHAGTRTSAFGRPVSGQDEVFARARLFF